MNKFDMILITDHLYMTHFFSLSERFKDLCDSGFGNIMMICLDVSLFFTSIVWGLME